MGKIDPFKYLASGKAYNEMRELRPGLAGVYHENGHMYASDAHILVRLKQDYPKNLEKKLIGKDGKEVPEMMNRKPTGKKAKPADFDRVIPSIKTINEDYAVYAIDPGNLKEKLKGKKVQDGLFVSFVDKDSGKFVSKFNAGYLLKVADFMIKTKHPFALLNVSNSTKPMLVNTEGSLLMLMPVSNYNPEQEYAEMKIELIPEPEKPSSRPTKIEKVRQPVTPKPKFKPKNAMKPIKINGRLYSGLAVASSVEKCLQYAQEYMYWSKKPYVDDSGWVHQQDGRKTNLYIHEWKGRIYLLRPESQIDPSEEFKNLTEKPTVMRKSTKKSACSTAKKSGNTIKMASKILKSQKEDYQKIFRTEVKKSKDPKTGAKKAGRIYRERYGATAEARWKKALKRAK